MHKIKICANKAGQACSGNRSVEVVASDCMGIDQLAYSAFFPCHCLPVGTGQPRPPLGLKSINFDHEIMQNDIICLNLVEKM
jgi:hypothetical protein